MSCENVQDRISSLLDGRMTSAEEGNALAHLGRCRSCNAQFQSVRNLRSALQTMQQPPIPAGLATRLRVLASHERQRRIRNANLSARLQHWFEHVRLTFDNMMRPMALPFAGGVMTALLLLGIWVPTLASKQGSNDVPLPYWGYAQAIPTEYPAMGDELVIELTIDERGRVADYSVLHGELTPAWSASLLLWKFEPAMWYGQPITAKLVYRGSSQVSVRG